MSRQTRAEDQGGDKAGIGAPSGRAKAPVSTGCGMDYILRRILYAIPIALGVTVIVFSLVYMGPVDPLTAVTPDDAEPHVIEMIKKQYGFDKPIPVQYLIWLKRALMGDFGVSLQSNRPVIEEVIPALRKTMMLAMVAFFPTASSITRLD